LMGISQVLIFLLDCPAVLEYNKPMACFIEKAQE